MVGGEDAGLPIMTGCNDVPNDAPLIRPRCIADCQNCTTRGTTPLANGTYVLADLLLYSLECDALLTTSVRGKLRVSGNVMDLVIQQPAGAAGDTIVGRMVYTFTLAGANMNVLMTCPTMDGGAPSNTGVNYMSDGRRFHFSILPGLQGDAIFSPQ